MLLTIDKNHKDHLAFLISATPEIVREFAKISINFLKKGINKKVYHTAAQKLGVEAEVVRQGIEGLMHLFVEGAKQKLSDVDFQESLVTLGFSTELTAELHSLFQENKKEIRKILAAIASTTPQYHNLEWRLDVEIASRSLRNQVNPITVLKLVQTRGDSKESVLLQTDPLNLVHMTEVLDRALQEMKTQHCRRISRLIK